MDDTNRRKQIIYRANHRGIKEMDIIVGRYATEKAMTMDPADLDLFETILNQPDRDLFSWFTGEVAVPDSFDTPLFKDILDFTQSNISGRS
jgi:antitoxin CptB